MKMHYLLSLVIHTVIVSMIFGACALGIQKSPETVTIVLSNDAFMAGGSGGDEKVPGSEVMEKNEKKIIREILKVKRHKKISSTGKIELKKTENTIPSNDLSDFALLGKPMPANTDIDEDDSGVGFGGAVSARVDMVPVPVTAARELAVQAVTAKGMVQVNQKNL
jgi:hypothetical protein